MLVTSKNNQAIQFQTKLHYIAKKLREKQTTAEYILWQQLRRKQINNAKFKRQHPIGRYIADFYCRKAKLIIEVDGLIHEKQIERDQARDLYLLQLGYTVLRFSNNQVINNINEVLNIFHHSPLLLGEGLGERYVLSPQTRLKFLGA
ncbi:MAG: DUF559 domain-containing protein [Patescibacteria group bacterium]